MTLSDTLAEDARGLSERLGNLGELAHAAADNARESAAKDRAALKERVAKARSSADDQAGQLRERSKGRSGHANRDWHDLQRSWGAHLARIRKRVDDRKAEHDLHRAQHRAESAEDDALDAIDFAASAVNEAAYAVLDAILARSEAEELAAS